MLIDRSGVDLWVESTPGAGETVLLISGADSPCTHWPQELVDGLADAELGVVRFDHRDVGRSGRVDALYSLDDLVGDALGVLDALDIPRAHVLGSSMGGMVGQRLVIDHGDRVLSLTVVISSPDPHRVRLSPPDPDWETALTELVLAPAPRTVEERADRAVETARLYAGTRYPFAAEAKRTRALAELEAGWPEESGHGLAIGQTDPWFDRLDRIEVPTLIVHGDSDPLFAVDHAEFLVDAIPRAQLLVLAGLGHEVTPGLAEEMLPPLRALYA